MVKSSSSCVSLPWQKKAERRQTNGARLPFTSCSELICGMKAGMMDPADSTETDFHTDQRRFTAQSSESSESSDRDDASNRLFPPTEDPGPKKQPPSSLWAHLNTESCCCWTKKSLLYLRTWGETLWFLSEMWLNIKTDVNGGHRSDKTWWHKAPHQRLSSSSSLF